MSHNGTSARARLDAWRERRADRLDPVRFHFIEALARRAADREGEVRRILDDRLSALMEAYARDLETAAPSLGNDADPATPSVSALTALGRLIEHAANRAKPSAIAVADDAASRAAMPGQLDALGEFRKIWSKLRAESQLRQSLEQVPADAGPLNSGALVHRTIALMRELSPGYLQHFLAYVDALSWLQQMSDRGVLAPAETPQASTARKRVRDKRPPSANQADGRKRGTRSLKSRTSSESMNS